MVENIYIYTTKYIYHTPAPLSTLIKSRIFTQFRPADQSTLERVYVYYMFEKKTTQAETRIDIRWPTAKPSAYSSNERTNKQTNQQPNNKIRPSALVFVYPETKHIHVYDMWGNCNLFKFSISLYIEDHDSLCMCAAARGCVCEQTDICSCQSDR